MSTLIALRLAKFLALAAFAAGIGLVAGQPRQADRLRTALWLVTPSVWAVWFVGYLLLFVGGRKVHEPFVALSLGASLIALHGAVLAAGRPRPKWISRALGPAGLGAATAAMVARDQAAPALAVAIAAGALVGGALVALLPAPEGGEDPGAKASIVGWFRWIARLEGLSLILLMGVAMPLRRAFDVHVDGGSGALGWAHGTLWILYLQALQLAARALGWGVKDVALAFVASLLPFGTVVLERVKLREG